jgi:hypothetical protein
VDAPDECPSDVRDSFIAPTTIENNFLWAKSLTKMRNQMESVANARILLGGRTHGFKGKYAGVLEEFIISQANNHPVYLLGGFGGVTKAIVNIIEESTIESFLFEEAKKDSSYADFFEYYNEKDGANQINYLAVYNEIKTKNILGLNNGLTEDENKILFHSTNVLEIVALILKGLNNKFKTT